MVTVFYFVPLNSPDYGIYILCLVAALLGSPYI